MASIPFMAFSRETWCDFRVNRCATLLRICVSSIESTPIVLLGMLYVGYYLTWAEKIDISQLLVLLCKFALKILYWDLFELFTSGGIY